MNNKKFIMLKTVILSFSIYSIFAPQFSKLKREFNADFVSIEAAKHLRPAIDAATAGIEDDREKAEIKADIIKHFIESIHNMNLQETERRRNILQRSERSAENIQDQINAFNMVVTNLLENQREEKLRIEQIAEREKRREKANFEAGFKILPEYIILKRTLESSVDTHLDNIRDKIAKLSLMLYSAEQEINKRKINNILGLLFKRILHMISIEEDGKFFTDFTHDDTSKEYKKELLISTNTISHTMLAKTMLGDISFKILNSPIEVRPETQKYLNELIQMIDEANQANRRYLRLLNFHSYAGATVA